MREPGYYWVKYRQRASPTIAWYVAEYSAEADRWFLPGDGTWFNDSSFLQVDERRIERTVTFPGNFKIVGNDLIPPDTIIIK